MILIIVLLALVLRLINLNQSLWFDEAINVLSAKNLGFWHYVTGYPIGDFHPPGYFVLLWIWGHLFGFSEISVRMPSVLLGIATVYIVYLIGRDLFSKKVGLLAALMLAISPLHVYYSQEARMYCLAAFAATLSFYGLVKILSGKKSFWWVYGLGVLLVLLSDYVEYLIILTQLLYLAVYERKKIKTILILQIVSGIIFSPWLLIFPSQLINGQITAQNVPGWAQVVGGASIKSWVLVYVKAVIGRISVVDKFLYGVLVAPVGLLYCWLVLLLFKNKNPQNMWPFFWTFVPTMLAFLLSFFIPVLSYFRMLFIVPGLSLLVAHAVFLVGPKWQKIVILSLIVISLGCLTTYYINPQFQRENWKGLRGYFESSNRGSLILFENNDIPAPFLYYLQNTNPENIYQKGLQNFPAKNINDVADINTNYKQIFLVDYLVGISDPNRAIDQKLTNMRYKVVRVIDFPSLGLVYEYTKPD